MARKRNNTSSVQTIENHAEADAAVEAFHTLESADQIAAWPPLQKMLAAFLRRTWAHPPRDALATAQTLYRKPESHRKTRIFRPSPAPADYVKGADD